MRINIKRGFDRLSILLSLPLFVGAFVFGGLTVYYVEKVVPNVWEEVENYPSKTLGPNREVLDPVLIEALRSADIEKNIKNDKGLSVVTVDDKFLVHLNKAEITVAGRQNSLIGKIWRANLGEPFVLLILSFVLFIGCRAVGWVVQGFLPSKAEGTIT